MGKRAIGWDWADPVAGPLITAAIAVVLRQAAREIYRPLMDAVDPALVDQTERNLAATPGVPTVGGPAVADRSGRRSRGQPGHGSTPSVAHRTATARSATRVPVMEAGHVAEQGTPGELLRAGKRFAALAALDEAGWEWADAPAGRPPVGGSPARTRQPSSDNLENA